MRPSASDQRGRAPALQRSSDEATVEKFWPSVSEIVAKPTPPVELFAKASITKGVAPAGVANHARQAATQRIAVSLITKRSTA
jgi:hypothetical protein